jgi:hypothetical protein
MKNNQKDQRNQDKTGKASTQKTTNDANKKETFNNNSSGKPNKKQDGIEKDLKDQNKNKPNAPDKTIIGN